MIGEMVGKSFHLGGSGWERMLVSVSGKWFVGAQSIRPRSMQARRLRSEERRAEWEVIIQLSGMMFEE